MEAEKVRDATVLMEGRTLRFLIPPFVFLLFILWGIFLNPPAPENKLIVLIENFDGELKIETMISVLSGAFVLIIALGYLFGGIKVFLAHLLYLLIYKDWHYECSSSNEAAKDMVKLFKRTDLTEESFDKDFKFCLSATYVYTLLPHSMNNWIKRRWESFATSSNTAIALLCALLFCIINEIKVCDWKLIVPFVALLIVMTINACIAHRETRMMIEFLAKLGINNSNSSHT